MFYDYKFSIPIFLKQPMAKKAFLDVKKRKMPI